MDGREPTHARGSGRATHPSSLGSLTTCEHVLDLGSGAGTDRRVAAELGADNVRFVEGEAESLPFENASIDVVICNGAIDLIPDKNAVFAELHQVLRPGGRIQLADVTIWPTCSRNGVKVTHVRHPLCARCSRVVLYGWSSSASQSTVASCSPESAPKSLRSVPAKAPTSPHYPEGVRGIVAV